MSFFILLNLAVPVVGFSYYSLNYWHKSCHGTAQLCCRDVIMMCNSSLGCRCLFACAFVCVHCCVCVGVVQELVNVHSLVIAHAGLGFATLMCPC